MKGLLLGAVCLVVLLAIPIATAVVLDILDDLHLRPYYGPVCRLCGCSTLHPCTPTCRLEFDFPKQPICSVCRSFQMAMKELDAEEEDAKRQAEAERNAEGLGG